MNLLQQFQGVLGSLMLGGLLLFFFHFFQTFFNHKYLRFFWYAFQALYFLSFAVGDKTQQLKSNDSVQIIHTSYRHTYDPKTAYLVSPDIFEYIFNCPAVSNRIVEYISTYRYWIRPGYT